MAAVPINSGGVDRGGVAICTTIIIVGFAFLSAWGFRRKAIEEGLDPRGVRNISITAAFPCWSWVFAWMYIVHCSHEVNLWFWMWLLVIMAGSVIGLFVWIPLFLIKVRKD